MRPLTSLLITGLMIGLVVLAGCSSPDARLRAQRQQCQERITELKTDLQDQRDESKSVQDELNRQKTLAERIREEMEVQDAEFKELLTAYEDLAEKSGRSGPLPEELNKLLAAFAEANSEMLSYDPSKGLVRVKSDVTFSLGSDQVKAQAKPALAALAQICSAEQAQGCRVLVVGHTDDMPIVRPETRAKHPTNWHLSVHRAIAVMNVLKGSMPEERLSVMGLGQFKPIADNQPNNRGNPLNRRVEIFIVPEDTAAPSVGL